MTEDEQDKLKRRLEDAKQRARDASEAWPVHPDVGPYAGPPFVPYATMFKHAGPPSDEGIVRCVACNWPYPYTDILDGELEEDHCPNCNTWSQNFYRNKPHRKVSPNA